MSDEKKEKGLFKSLSQLSFVKKLKSIKYIEVIIIVIFVLILLLICFSGSNVFSFLSTSSTVFMDKTSAYTINYVTTAEYAQNLEEKLTTLLKSIKDVGNVEVMVSLNGSMEITFVSDETITTSRQTTTTKNQIIYIEKDGTNYPIIVSEVEPKINGIVIVSSGAKDTKVKLNIISAVQTLINIDVEKIQVFVGN